MDRPFLNCNNDGNVITGTGVLLTKMFNFGKYVRLTVRVGVFVGVGDCLYKFFDTIHSFVFIHMLWPWL